MSVIEFAQHAAIDHFEVRDGCLVVGGRSVVDLAEELGATPFYAYDRAVVRKKVALLRAALPAEIKLHFAIKANPHPQLLADIAPLFDGLDVASAAELEVALTTATPREEISFAGPGKRIPELAAAVDAGIVINLESETEMRRVAALAAERRVLPKVAVRVNPDFQLKTSGMKMGGGSQQFGVDAERVPAMLNEMRELPLAFHGFHIFSGSQNLRPEAIVEAQQKTCELAIELAGAAPAPVRMLNIGGGLGIPYFPGDVPLDLAPIGANLAALLPQVRAALPEAEPVIELGRFFVGECGVYICRVIDRKISRGQVFLITDGGLHHHLAASGNFGQIIRKNYPVAVANKIGAADTETASVVGPLCTPLDLLADRMQLAHADVGDLVAVFQSGAYGYTASPLGFLSHPAPAEIVL